MQIFLLIALILIISLLNIENTAVGVLLAIWDFWEKLWNTRWKKVYA